MDNIGTPPLDANDIVHFKDLRDLTHLDDLDHLDHSCDIDHIADLEMKNSSYYLDFTDLTGGFGLQKDLKT